MSASNLNRTICLSARSNACWHVSEEETWLWIPTPGPSFLKFDPSLNLPCILYKQSLSIVLLFIRALFFSPSRYFWIMKVKAALNSYMPTIDTDKENIHPNIMRPTPPYPQVSSFCHDISHSSKDWHSRILEPSSREKALSRKLSRML